MEESLAGDLTDVNETGEEIIEEYLGGEVLDSLPESSGLTLESDRFVVRRIVDTRLDMNSIQSRLSF